MKGNVIKDLIDALIKGTITLDEIDTNANILPIEDIEDIENNKE